MKILILGGTGFIGPHEVERCIARGWEVTIFNRGRSKASMFDAAFEKVTRLQGDRDPKKGDGLSEIKAAIDNGARWDAVIDNSCYVPRIAKASAELLKDAAKQYIFISSVSVYAENNVLNQDEDAAVGTLDDPTTEEVSGLTYGPLKALAEQEVEAVFGERASIVRPGLIVGPGDKTDRFTCWPVRVSRGGDVVVPSDPQNVQFIDARDLAEFINELVEGGHGGKFNAVGPRGEMFFREMVDGCRAVVSNAVMFIAMPDSFLVEQGIGQWAGKNSLGMWIAKSDDMEHFAQRSNARALAVGMPLRPLADTARDTLRWFLSTDRADDETLRAGLSPEKEAEVLSAWRAKQDKA